MKAAIAAATVAVILATPASAQSVATMRITADGQASITVAPGTPIHLDAIVSWTLGPQTGGVGSQNTFAGIKGDIIVTDHAGVPANFTSHYSAGALVNLGSFVGGSRLGIDVAITPSWWGGFIIPPNGNSAGILIAGYDLTLPALGTYHVNWIPAPDAPLVRVFPSVTSPAFAEIPTTYIGATITVTPAPAAACILITAALVPRRRRPD